MIFFVQEVKTTLHVKLFTVRDKICAWDMHDDVSDTYYNGGARPFKNKSFMDELNSSDFYDSPFTRKQLKALPYIIKKADLFEEAFENADSITPEGNYENIIKSTFGDKSNVYKLYHEKAIAPEISTFKPTLYIDFEAVNMRICGWYAELELENETITYEGIAKPFSDTRFMKRMWDKVYSELLPYSFDDIMNAPHINKFKRYFIDMFSKAKKIVTYGDTDAFFVQKTFGDDLYNFFKIKNSDVSIHYGNTSISLEKLCKLCNVQMDGAVHDPKIDVLKMRRCLEIINEL